MKKEGIQTRKRKPKSSSNHMGLQNTGGLAMHNHTRTMSK